MHVMMFAEILSYCVKPQRELGDLQMCTAMHAAMMQVKTFEANTLQCLQEARETCLLAVSIL